MLNTHAIGSDFTIKINRAATLTLPPDIEKEVDRLWQVEQKRRGESIFNGHMIAAVHLSSTGIQGYITEYRYFIAQRANPALFTFFNLRPIAVSGLLKCRDGIIIGRRAVAMTQDGGSWELVPSGGLDVTSDDLAQNTMEADVNLQVLTELHEEIGIPSGNVFDLHRFCLIEDTDSHVIDIGVAMRTPLSYDEIENIYRDITCKEYDKLRLIPYIELKDWIQKCKLNFVSVSMELINYYFNIRV